MTNPDNVGGLPELPEDSLRVSRGSCESVYYTPQQMHEMYHQGWSDALAELCRAAPAGGDELAKRYARDMEDTLGKIAEAVGLNPREPDADKLIAAVKRVSAPAGSGEVDYKVVALVDQLIDAVWDEANSDIRGTQAEAINAGKVTERVKRALLRKLQQGAAPEELSGNGVKVESGFTGSGHGPVTPTVLISFAAGDFFSRDRFMRMIVAASQGQEGGNE